MKSYKDIQQNLQESGLSRLWRHNEEHDCGAMTAFRVGADCGEGKAYTNKENKQRNKSLLAKLKSKGYGITKLLGKYPEGGKSVTESSWFVVDLNDSGKLEADMKRLGEEFDQDSILFIPKGSIKIKGCPPCAELVGTNRCDNNWLGYGKREKFENGKLGYDSPIYTSYVNGRPFLFEGVGEEIKSPAGGMGVWYMHRLAEKKWQDIDIDD